MNYHEFNNFIAAGFVRYTFYVTLKGVMLNYQEFNSIIAAGLVQFTLYATLQGIMLNSFEFNSGVCCGLIVYKRELSLTRVSYYPGDDFGIGVCIYITPSGICLPANDPRTNFIFNNYKMGPRSNRKNFNRALKIDRRSIKNNYFRS